MSIEDPGRHPPPDAEALLRRAFALHRQGQLAEAAEAYRQVLRREPANFDALHLLGLAAHQSGDHALAVDLISAALRIDQTQADACANLGLALQALGRFPEALAFTEAALSLRPGFPVAHSNRGNLLRTLKRLPEALESLDRAVALDPTDAAAINNRGNVLQDLERPGDALRDFDRALALRPDLSEARLNRANALRKLHRLDDALACLDALLALRPQDAEAHSNRGAVLQELRRMDEAIAAYDQALELRPDFAGARFNKSLALLLTGRFAEGWSLYESRVAQGRTDLPAAPWRGETDVHGLTLLLHAEQGLGDTLQFCRYAALVKERGAQVILRVPASLAGLVSTAPGVDAVVTEAEPLPAFDAHCPMLSLPLAFGARLDQATGPSPYLFSRPERRSEWSQRLGEARGLRVGLAWSGAWSPSTGYNRSVPLAELLRHLPDGPTYISLQKEVRPVDQAALASSTVRFLGDEIRDFEDTAALCDLMDVVISVDTSIAHLAGALGRPTCVLLACVPDWRWLLDRTDCPWYPTARLYRQPETGNWTPVLEQVAADLSRRP